MVADPGAVALKGGHQRKHYFFPKNILQSNLFRGNGGQQQNRQNTAAATCEVDAACKPSLTKVQSDNF